MDTEKTRVLLDPAGRRMDEVFSPSDRQRLDRTVEVVWGRDDPMPTDEALATLHQVTTVVCSGWRYGALPDDGAELRAIIDVSGRLPSGLNYDACFQRGIRVLTAAPAFAPAVAEMGLGLALAASREIVVGDTAMRHGAEEWQHAGNQTTFLLYNQRVGFIGFGALARSLRALLAPFGCSIVVYDPWLSDGFLRSQGVEAAGLEEVVATSKVVFVLAVPSSANRALLSREVLGLIQAGSVLVLLSRAHVVDFDALTEFVSEGRFKAAIDVFPTEPLPLDHPVRRAKGAILSAHRAGPVREALWALGEMVVDDIEAIARHLPPQRLQQAQPELIAMTASTHY
jgi:phosphoglycerate dehydrogenase-like enzyme